MVLRPSFVHLYFVSKVDKNRNMPRPIGLPKTGGRKIGSLNKRGTISYPFLVNEFQFDPVDELIKSIMSLPQDQRAVHLLKLMDLIFHKRKPVEESIIDLGY